MVESLLGMLVVVCSTISTAEKQNINSTKKHIRDSTVYDLIYTEGRDTSELLNLKTGRWGVVQELLWVIANRL